MDAKGIDVQSKYQDIYKLVLSVLRDERAKRYLKAAEQAGRRGRRLAGEGEDLVQEVAILIHRRNSTPSAFDPARASFSKYVVLCTWHVLTHATEGRDGEAPLADPEAWTRMPAEVQEGLSPEARATVEAHEKELLGLKKAVERDAATGQRRLFAIEDELPAAVAAVVREVA